MKNKLKKMMVLSNLNFKNFVLILSKSRTFTTSRIFNYPGNGDNVGNEVIQGSNSSEFYSKILDELIEKNIDYLTNEYNIFRKHLQLEDRSLVKYIHENVHQTPRFLSNEFRNKSGDLDLREAEIGRKA